MIFGLVTAQMDVLTLVNKLRHVDGQGCKRFKAAAQKHAELAPKCL
jgi:hypothetical protein